MTRLGTADGDRYARGTVVIVLRHAHRITGVLMILVGLGMMLLDSYSRQRRRWLAETRAQKHVKRSSFTKVMSSPVYGSSVTCRTLWPVTLSTGWPGATSVNP